MFTSITGPTVTETTEQVPKTSPPWVWVGFIFAALFMIVEVALVIMLEDDSQMMLALGLLGLPGVFYWLFCVHRFHKILAEITQGRYPISPLEAALKHFIPFYNLYWTFRWPGELSDYLNRRGRVQIISGSVIGVLLLLAWITFRVLDGAIGLAFLFGIGMFISSKLKAHVKALKGITADQLPPLPDPRIFSRPIETTASPVQEPVEGSGAGYR